MRLQDYLVIAFVAVITVGIIIYLIKQKLNNRASKKCAGCPLSSKCMDGEVSCKKEKLNR